MSKLVVVGCSGSAGTGFNPADILADCPESSYLWVNLLHKNVDRLKNYTLINLAVGGQSNSDIFESAVSAIANHLNEQTSELWCQWTSLHRFRADAGFELYPTHFSFTKNPKYEVRTNQFVLTKNFLKKFSTEFRAIIHPHREICKILKYVDIINQLCQQKKIKVYHINGGCPWDVGYFEKLSGPDITPNDYTSYTKEQILFTDNRNDTEIFDLYNKLHNEYQPLISKQKQTWLNLDTSLLSQKIDYNYDNVHPGIKSNQLFFNFLKPLLLG
jgi:hypothetical protein